MVQPIYCKRESDVPLVHVIRSVRVEARSAPIARNVHGVAAAWPWLQHGRFAIRTFADANPTDEFVLRLMIYRHVGRSICIGSTSIAHSARKLQPTTTQTPPNHSVRRSMTTMC